MDILQLFLVGYNFVLLIELPKPVIFIQILCIFLNQSKCKMKGFLKNFLLLLLCFNMLETSRCQCHQNQIRLFGADLMGKFLKIISSQAEF